ncbi:MAG: DUF6036 family nucleotidyltransferase [Coriobacteriia bacterium]
MRYDQLEHAIRAACDVSGDTELIIFGSQAILATAPDAPASLRASIEVDIQAKTFPERTDLIDGALGEDSVFHATHGFYVHGVSVAAATLPDSWENRTIPVRHAVGTHGRTGHCIEAHDLAASKLVAGREKDRIFVATLLSERLIDSDVLLRRIEALPVDSECIARLTKWVSIIVEDLSSS